ncbi:pimeloyl-ACP methyl ester carboxylesterase [Nocardia transvalensis]|uniref:Pimeloyl-ACP methyl ester carboxylesterase n=1 Tax=Nocardia transvalensis TaxID=37333 RepID=A0A7W9P8Z5_9NOCA|nr:alpha/beta hydrolase [Nocardia transvalensis]MBB5911398.1 pimeloyl-ACP methyl ester carboxylesterase [Nocardia transvalensis]
MRVVLIHGAATDSRVWSATAAALRGTAEVLCPDRPQSGDMDTEIAFLAPLCAGAFVAGVSGGATLGLELAARGVPLAGALLHEPAAGSLAPGLLDHVAAALASEGVEGFGRALYGPLWRPDRTEASVATVRAEFAMFRGFEPAPLGTAHSVTLTVGANSPRPRHDSVRALAEHLGAGVRILPGVGHAAHLESGETLAGVIDTMVDDLTAASPGRHPLG